MKKFLLIVFAAMLVFAFTVPAKAAVTAKMDAVLIFDTAWLSTDDAYQQNTIGNPIDTGWEGGSININPFGFYGFTLKDKNVGVRANVAPRGYGDDLNGSDTMFLREFYGWWQVNKMFKLVVGQLHTLHTGIGPSYIFGAVTPISGAPGWAGPMRAGLYTYLLGFGNHFSRRVPQVQLNFAFSPNVGLQVAFLDPQNAGGDDETVMPRIDLTVTLKFGPITLMPSYMTMERDFKYDTGVTGDGSLDIHQWALPVRVSVGGFTFQGEYHQGVNIGNSTLYPHRTGYNLAGGITTAAVADPGGKFYDTETVAWWAEVNYKAGKFKPGLLYGSQESENTEAALGAARFEHAQSMWGIFLKWSAAPHWTITPHYSEYDHGNDTLYTTGVGVDGPDMGKVQHYGINFMVAF